MRRDPRRTCWLLLRSWVPCFESLTSNLIFPSLVALAKQVVNRNFFFVWCAKNEFLFILKVLYPNESKPQKLVHTVLDAGNEKKLKFGKSWILNNGQEDKTPKKLRMPTFQLFPKLKAFCSCFLFSTCRKHFSSNRQEANFSSSKSGLIYIHCACGNVLCTFNASISSLLSWLIFSRSCVAAFNFHPHCSSLPSLVLYFAHILRRFIGIIMHQKGFSALCFLPAWRNKISNLLYLTRKEKAINLWANWNFHLRT